MASIEPTPPPEAQTEAEKTAYCAGWWAALEAAGKAEPVQEPGFWGRVAARQAGRIKQLETAAQQALVALEKYQRMMLAEAGCQSAEGEAAIDTFRAALAEPQEPDLWGAGYEAGYAAGMAERPAEPVQQPVGYLPAYELDRLQSGHDGRLRSAKFGASVLDGDVAVYTAPPQRPAEPEGGGNLPPPLLAEPVQEPVACADNSEREVLSRIKLPCDVRIGHGTHGKGTTLWSLVTRARALYQMTLEYSQRQQSELQKLRPLASLQRPAEPEGGGNLPPPLLAEPVQEPVASIYITPNGAREFDDWRHDLPVGSNLLYAAPPQCKPLTEKETDKAYREICRDLPIDFDHTPAGWIEQGIRYAERAHGIGGKDE